MVVLANAVVQQNHVAVCLLHIIRLNRRDLVGHFADDSGLMNTEALVP
jgi:hypothetical protein